MNLTQKRLKNVMVVDDDEDYNFITEEIFNDFDPDTKLIFKVWASEALEYLDDENNEFPDLIFLDINMPIMNGWDFLREYESRNYHNTYPTIIVMISTSVFREDKIKAKSFKRVAEFIEKPIMAKHLDFLKENYFSS